MEQADKQTAY